MQRFDIPSDAGPGGTFGWHHVITRLLEDRFDPAVRARMLWRLDRREYAAARQMLQRHVRPGDTALDIGANWGLFAHHLADRVGPFGRVVAFEPNPGPLRTLQAMADRRPQLTVHAVALSDTTGAAQLHVPVSPAGTVLRERAVHAMATVSPPDHRPATAYRTAPVATRRLDDMVDEGLVPDRVSFLKCDVEGHELAVLRGAADLLRRSRPTILIEVEQRHQETSIEEVFAFLTDLGFTGHVLDQERLRPLADFDVGRDQLRHLRANALFAAPAPGYLFEFVFTP